MICCCSLAGTKACEYCSNRMMYYDSQSRTEVITDVEWKFRPILKEYEKKDDWEIPSFMEKQNESNISN